MVSLGLSALLGVAAAAYFWSRGDPLTGVVIAAALLLAGGWEYRRKLTDLREQARAEAKR